jgi:hypothetical protein
MNKTAKIAKPSHLVDPHPGSDFSGRFMTVASAQLIGKPTAGNRYRSLILPHRTYENIKLSLG